VLYSSANDSIKFEFANDLKCANAPSLDECHASQMRKMLFLLAWMSFTKAISKLSLTSNLSNAIPVHVLAHEDTSRVYKTNTAWFCLTKQHEQLNLILAPRCCGIAWALGPSMELWKRVKESLQPTSMSLPCAPFTQPTWALYSCAA